MRWFVIPLTLLGLASVAVAGPAGLTPEETKAQESKSQARRHFRLGMAAFTLERYDDAIKEFESGFLVEPDPVFLYNMGQAFRLSKRPDQAIVYYKKYLALSPNAVNRVEVEGRMEAMKKLLEEKDRPPQTVVEPGTSPTPDRPPTATTATTTTTTPTTPTTPTATTTPRGNGATTVPLVPTTVVEPAPRKKWPIIVGVVAGVVVVGAGVGLGVGLGTSGKTPESSGFVDISQ